MPTNLAKQPPTELEECKEEVVRPNPTALLERKAEMLDDLQDKLGQLGGRLRALESLLESTVATSGQRQEVFTPCNNERDFKNAARTIAVPAMVGLMVACGLVLGVVLAFVIY